MNFAERFRVIKALGKEEYYVEDKAKRGFLGIGNKAHGPFDFRRAMDFLNRMSRMMKKEPA